MTKQITKDLIYDAVAPDDFGSMIEPDRYNQRSTAFDRIITQTHDHFWDPLNPEYIDFSTPFDMDNIMMVPEKFVPSLECDYLQKALDEKQRIAYVNEITRWMLSSILHGEQGAMALSASLCHILRDQGAQEYAANQTREEARHVTAFASYIQARWGSPLPIGPTLGSLLTEMVNSPAVYKKIVGMQLLVEGLAMGAFASLHSESSDPLLVRLTQLTMTDEAFHHKFGKIWAQRTMPHLTEEERDIIEDWAAECFQTLLLNLLNPEQMKPVYAKFGLDWERVMLEMAEIMTDEKRREEMAEGTNIFRVLIKTLIKADIITDRTRHIYATYVDMDELKSEGDEMIGDAIANEGIEYLKKINASKNKVLFGSAAE